MPFRQPNYQVRRREHACCYAHAHTRARQGRFRMTMGLQPMPAEEWIDIDESYGSEMALRQRLVAEQRELVLASQPQVSTLESGSKSAGGAAARWSQLSLQQLQARVHTSSTGAVAA